jgi:hypothetical protein
VPTPHPGWHTIDLSDKPPLPQPVDAGTALLLTEQQAERDMASGAHDVASIRGGSLEAGLDVIHTTVERWRKDTTKRALSARLISRTMRWAVSSGPPPGGTPTRGLPRGSRSNPRGRPSGPGRGGGHRTQALDACRRHGVPLPGRELSSSLMALAGPVRGPHHADAGRVRLLRHRRRPHGARLGARGGVRRRPAASGGILWRTVFGAVTLPMEARPDHGRGGHWLSVSPPASDWSVSRVLDALATSARQEAELLVDSGAGAEAEARGG